MDCDKGERRLKGEVVVWINVIGIGYEDDDLNYVVSIKLFIMLCFVCLLIVCIVVYKVCLSNCIV